jgi:hypothetical protein
VDQSAGEDGGGERRRAGIDWEADRTEDRALLGSNPSAAPVAEIGWGKEFLAPPSAPLWQSGELAPRGPQGLNAYLGT